MRLFKTLLIAAIAVFVATSASALVSVTHTSNAAGPLLIGETFEVEVSVGYNGDPAGLTGLFVSAGWDPTQLQLVGTNIPFQPFAIFAGGLGSLGKIADGGQSFPGDPAGTTRTVQYQALPGQQGNNDFGNPTVVTNLVFEVIGAGDLTAEIDVIFNQGDVILFNGTDPNNGAGNFTSASVSIVPEPGTALLMSLGLAGLASAGRRNR